MRTILLASLLLIAACFGNANAHELAPEDTVSACAYVPLDTDEYLYSLWERAPKFDRSGPFGYKDLIAAERLGKSPKEYIIGGVDPQYRRTFARAAQIMELYGFDPSINTGFRGDYRQRLVSDRGKAAIGYSYHGGSHRGGWGHGLAFDVVSARATSESVNERYAASEPLWDWIDKYGPSLGIGRPYGSGDAMHVAPVWSPEYAAKRSYAKRHHGSRRIRHAHHHRHRRVHVARR